MPERFEFESGDVVQIVHLSGKVGKGTVVGYNLVTHAYIVEWYHEGELDSGEFPVERITLW